MQIGAMNHPKHDVLGEIRWMAEMGLDFIDLTLEPPAAASWRIDAKQIRKAIGDHGLGIVGHTPYYVPIGSPIEEIRKAAVAELKRCLERFAEIGAKWMNVHADRYAPMHDRAFYIEQDIQSLRELLETSRQVGVGVMVENIPRDFNNARQLGELLDPLPNLGLHLDIGHANLLVDHNTTEEILAAHSGRLRHVHLHDNLGGSGDLHLPLGAGTMDVARHVRALKATGYDGTITLEVFTPDKTYLQYSRDVLLRVWSGC